MIYLYAITGAETGLPECPGLGEEPLAALRFGNLVAVCSEHAGDAPVEDVGALWRHDLVLERAIERGPALPVRFGTTFADRREALGALGPRMESFRRQLLRLGGCVELAVRLELVGQDGSSGSSPDAGMPADGRSYLEAKLSTQRALRRAAERTLPVLEELALASRRLSTATDPASVKASYLVRRGDVDGFVEAIRSVAVPDDEVRLICTGPWAPYSFVSGEPG